MNERGYPLTQADLDFMKRAVELEKLCVQEEGKSRPTPSVGVVVARDTQLLGEAYRGETGQGAHAEFCVLEKLKDLSLAGASVYTTLEPCSHRNPKKTPCAVRLVERGVSQVFIGMYDPNPQIYRAGWRILRDGGITPRDFTGELRREIYADNAKFVEQYRGGTGMSGSKSFDYLQNKGKFKISYEGADFNTGWTPAGHDVIHAIDDVNHVALARYAKDFEEIDDPAAFDFSKHSVTVRKNDIVVFRNANGFALIKVTGVLAGPDCGDPHTQLDIEWQLRIS